MPRPPFDWSAPGVLGLTQPMLRPPSSPAPESRVLPAPAPSWSTNPRRPFPSRFRSRPRASSRRSARDCGRSSGALRCSLSTVCRPSRLFEQLRCPPKGAWYRPRYPRFSGRARASLWSGRYPTPFRRRGTSRRLCSAAWPPSTCTRPLDFTVARRLSSLSPVLSIRGAGVRLVCAPTLSLAGRKTRRV